MSFLLILVVLLFLFAFQIIFSLLLHHPFIGIAFYGAFILYSWWKMKKLNTRNTKYHQSHKNDLSSKSNSNIIDVEYTEKVIEE